MYIFLTLPFINFLGEINFSVHFSSEKMFTSSNVRLRGASQPEESEEEEFSEMSIIHDIFPPKVVTV